LTIIFKDFGILKIDIKCVCHDIIILLLQCAEYDNSMEEVANFSIIHARDHNITNMHFMLN
jgi:hypothetical protein